MGIAHDASREVVDKQIGAVRINDPADGGERLVDGHILVFGGDVDKIGGQMHQLALNDREPAQLGFGALLRGDVPIGADHAQGVAGGIALDRGEAADVVGAAVGPEHAEFDVELLGVLQGELDFNVAALPVIRMQPRLPSLVGAAELLAGDAVEAEHLLVPFQAVVDHIVVPNAHTAGTRRERQTAAGLAQVFLGAFARSDVPADAEHAEQVAIGRPKRRLDGIDEDEPPVGIGDPLLVVAGCARCEHALVVPAELAAYHLAKQLDVGAAHDLIARQADKLGKRRIASQIGAVEILVKNDIRNAVEQ